MPSLLDYLRTVGCSASEIETIRTALIERVQAIPPALPFKSFPERLRKLAEPKYLEYEPSVAGYSREFITTAAAKLSIQELGLDTASTEKKSQSQYALMFAAQFEFLSIRHPMARTAFMAFFLFNFLNAKGVSIELEATTKHDHVFIKFTHQGQTVSLDPSLNPNHVFTATQFAALLGCYPQNTVQKQGFVMSISQKLSDRYVKLLPKLGRAFLNQLVKTQRVNATCPLIMKHSCGSTPFAPWNLFQTSWPSFVLDLVKKIKMFEDQAAPAAPRAQEAPKSLQHLAIVPYHAGAAHLRTLAFAAASLETRTLDCAVSSARTKEDLAPIAALAAAASAGGEEDSAETEFEVLTAEASPAGRGEIDWDFCDYPDADRPSTASSQATTGNGGTIVLGSEHPLFAAFGVQGPTNPLVATLFQSMYEEAAGATGSSVTRDPAEPQCCIQ